MTLAIRPESPMDIPSIGTVTAAAFASAPHTSGTEHFIVNALRRADTLSVSLVADEDGTIVGHVAVSPVSISDGTAGWFGLGPISVLPDHQRRGVGTRLMREAIERLRQGGARGCVVLGDPGYYARFGYRTVPGLILAGVPPDYFQALCFTPPPPRGEVSYHAAFDARA